MRRITEQDNLYVSVDKDAGTDDSHYADSTKYLITQPFKGDQKVIGGIKQEWMVNGICEGCGERLCMCPPQEVKEETETQKEVLSEQAEGGTVKEEAPSPEVYDYLVQENYRLKNTFANALRVAEDRFMERFQATGKEAIHRVMESVDSKYKEEIENAHIRIYELEGIIEEAIADGRLEGECIKDVKEAMNQNKINNWVKEQRWFHTTPTPKEDLMMMADAVRLGITELGMFREEGNQDHIKVDLGKDPTKERSETTAKKNTAKALRREKEFNESAVGTYSQMLGEAVNRMNNTTVFNK